MDTILMFSTIIGVALIALELGQTHGHVPKMNGYDGDSDTINRTKVKR
jgi:hypothetical protein